MTKMKLYRLVYASKTAKTVWYYTGQGMTATDGGWSQYENDALTVEKCKELLQVMRWGGPRVTGNSLEDHYFIEEKDEPPIFDERFFRVWNRHNQPAGEEYKEYQQTQESGQLNLFALQPDQVGDGWVNDRPVPATKAVPTVADAIKPASTTSVSAEDRVDQTIEPSEADDSDDLLKPLDLTGAVSVTDSKPETTIPFDDLLSSNEPTSVPVRDQLKADSNATVSNESTDDDTTSATDADLMDDPFEFDDLLARESTTTKAESESMPMLDDSPDELISVTDREQDDDEAWFGDLMAETASDDMVEEPSTSVTSDDGSAVGSDVNSDDLVDGSADVQAEPSAADDEPASADHESNSGETDDADPWADFDMDEAVAPAPVDEGSHDFTDSLDNKVRPAMLLDEVTGATFDEVDRMLVDQEWLGYLIRQGAMLDLWTPAAVEQLLATLQTDDETDTIEDLKAWWDARPEAKPDNLSAWLQWGGSLVTSLEGQDELSVYHHDLGAIAQMVSRALGVSKHSRWSDRVWTPLDRWLDHNHEHNLARLQELETQWRELVLTLPISQVAKDRLLGPETLNPLTIDDVKWQSVGDALAFLRQPVAATVWLSWRSIMEDMDVEDWRYADARYIYPAVMNWLQTVEPEVLDLQPHDPAWEVGVDYVATFGFELVDRVARFLQAQNQTDQVLRLIKYWTKPERIGVNDMDFRALWLNDLSQATSELRTSRGLNLWLEEQSPVPVLGRTVADLRPVVTVLHRYGQAEGHWPKDWWQAWSKEWLEAGLIDQAMADEVAQWGETDRFALTADLPWAQASDDLDKHFYTSGQYPADFKIMTDVAKDTPMSRVDMDIYDPRLIYQAIQYLQAALRQRKPAETMLNQLDGKIAQDMFHSLEMMNLSQLSDEQNREFLNLLQTTRRTRRQVKDLVLLLKALDGVFDGDKLPKLLHQLDNTASANRYHFRSQDFADALKDVLDRGKQD